MQFVMFLKWYFSVSMYVYDLPRGHHSMESSSPGIILLFQHIPRKIVRNLDGITSMMAMILMQDLPGTMSTTTHWTMMFGQLLYRGRLSMWSPFG
jgi:hypothetical protein